MGLTVKELTPVFAAEVSGINLLQPLPDETFAAIHQAIDRYGVLVFPGQALDDESQLAFSKRFGKLEKSLRRDLRQENQSEEVSDLSNVDGQGERLPEDNEKVVYGLGNEHWHSDSSFKPIPAKYSLLSARIIPPVGGETEFADARAAYDAWEGEDGISKAELADCICEHSIVYSRMVITGDIFSEEEKAKMPSVHQALVRTHPTTGRKIFYVGSHASHILGWPEEKGRKLLRRLTEWAIQPQFQFRHTWREQDLVMWDNRSVLHRGRPFDRSQFRRIMHRTTVMGDGPTA